MKGLPVVRRFVWALLFQWGLSSKVELLLNIQATGERYLQPLPLQASGIGPKARCEPATFETPGQYRDAAPSHIQK